MSNSPIQDLIDEGVVACYLDFRSGSFRDWSGNGHHATPTAPTHLRRNGANLNHSGLLSLASSAALDYSSFDSASIVMHFPDGYKPFVGAINYLWASANSDYFGANTDRHYLRVGATTSFQTVANPENARGVSFSWTSGSAPEFYIDGVFVANGSAVLTKIAQASNAVWLGTILAGERQLPCALGAVLLTTRALTATEQSKVYTELRSYDESWPQKVFARTRGFVNIDPNETGLVAGYNMKPNGNQIIDLSPNGNDGTIYGAIMQHFPIGPALFSRGYAPSYTNFGAGFQALTDLTVSFWLRVDPYIVASWAVDYYLSGADRWGVRLNFAGAGLVNLDIYDDIDNAGTSRYVTTRREGQYLHICVQMSSLQNLLYIDGVLVGSGESSSDYWNSFAGILYAGDVAAGTANTMHGALSALRVRSTVLSAAAIADEYQEGARAVLFKTDWGARETVANVTAGFLSNTPFRVGAGTFRIVTEEIDGMQCKVLECVTAGYVYLPTSIFQVGETQAAYGTWEWYMLKGGGGNFPRMGIIMSQADTTEGASQDGYAFRMNASEQVQLVRIDNGVATGLTATATAYVELDTWYKCRVARTTGDSFSTYVDDTPINYIGGSGANPVTDTTYTESKFMVWEPDAGDKLSLGDLKGDHAFIKFLGAVIYSTDGDFPDPGPV